MTKRVQTPQIGVNSFQEEKKKEETKKCLHNVFNTSIPKLDFYLKSFWSINDGGWLINQSIVKRWKEKNK